MLSEIAAIKTESELDLWVRKNIIIYYNNRELQKAVRRKRHELYESISNHHRDSAGR